MRCGLILSKESGHKRMSLERAKYLALKHGHLDGWPVEAILMACNVHPGKHVAAWDCSSGAYRKAVLQQLCPHYAHLRGLYFLVRGRVVHLGFEAAQWPPGAAENVLKELWLSTILPNGIEFVGKPDLYFVQSGYLYERKTSTHIKKANLPTPVHVRQCHAYQFLLESNEMPVHEIGIGYYGWMEPYHVSVVPAEHDDILEWLLPAAEIMHKALYNGWPRRIPSKAECSERACKYCDLKRECQALPSGDDAWEVTEVEWARWLRSLTAGS